MATVAKAGLVGKVFKVTLRSQLGKLKTNIRTRMHELSKKGVKTPLVNND